MIIGMVFLALSITVAVGTWWYVRLLETRLATGRSSHVRSRNIGKEGSAEPPIRPIRNNYKKDLSIKNFWEVEDIRSGVIVFKGGWNRMLLKIGPIDYHIMNDNEQYAIESVLMSCAMALGDHIQLFTTTDLVDTKNCAEAIRSFVESKENSPAGTMFEYGLSMYSFLTSMMHNRCVHNRPRYIAVSCHTNDGFEKAREELKQKALLMTNNLQRAKITVDILSSEQVLDVLYRFCNRGRIIKPSEAVSEGAMDLYVSGRREVKAHVFPEQDGRQKTVC